MNLLIKFPSRERPEKFFQVLDKYIQCANNINKIAFLLSFDADDVTMNNDSIKKRLKKYQDRGIKIVYFFGNNKTKVQAVNTDIEKVSGWDIILLASDDMIPIVQGYDDIIRDDMHNHFKDTDGILWYNDGGQNSINTLCILGKKYYDRFNYIYHPEYISLWCDNEFTDVSVFLKKAYKSDTTIIEHAHPVYQKTAYDSLYARNESYKEVDKTTYEKRKLLNFNLNKNPIKLTIAIPSLSNRIEKFLTPLCNKIQKQIGDNNDIELLVLIDNKKMTVGEKRTKLFGLARGRYTCIIDDDDDIVNDFIQTLRKKITNDLNVDVICYEQTANINGKNWTIKTSLKYNCKHPFDQLELDQTGNPLPCCRPPWHWCAWKTELVKKIPFGDSNTQEDTVFVLQAIDQAKTELVIDKIMCAYNWSATESQAKFEHISPHNVKKVKI